MTDSDMLELCEKRRERFVVWWLHSDYQFAHSHYLYDLHSDGLSSNRFDEFKEKHTDEPWHHIVPGNDYWSLDKGEVEKYYEKVKRCQEAIAAAQAELGELYAKNPSLKPPLTAKPSTIWKNFSSFKDGNSSKTPFKKNCKSASTVPKRPPQPRSVPIVKKNALSR